MQIGREWVEPKSIELSDGATFTLPNGTRVRMQSGRPVRVSNGKPIQIADGTKVTLPDGRQLPLRSGRKVTMDIRYREVEMIRADGTVKHMRQEAMSVSHKDLSEGGWVQRGSDSNLKGAEAERASRLISERRLAQGQIEGRLDVQNASGTGFDGVEIRLNRHNQPVLTVIEVKNYPGNWVPIEEFTAVIDNLRKNIDDLVERFTPPKSLIDDLGIDAAITQHAKNLDIDESLLRHTLDALDSRRIELEIRLAPRTKLGRQGSDSAYNRMWEAWRKFGSGAMAVRGRKKPLVVDIPPADMAAAAKLPTGAIPGNVGRRPRFYQLIEDVPSGARLTDQQIADARIATLGADSPNVTAIEGPLKHLGDPLPFQDSAGRPVAVRDVSPSEAQGAALERLVDDLEDTLTTRAIVDGTHKDVSVALGLDRLMPAQQDGVIQALTDRLAAVEGGAAALDRLVPVTEPI